jgi:hypothetical protein
MRGNLSPVKIFTVPRSLILSKITAKPQFVIKLPMEFII